MRFIVYAFGFFVCVLSVFAGATFFLFTKPWIEFSVLEYYNPGKPSILIDCEGKEWARFQVDCREPVAFSSMSPHIVNAFLAAEDHDFFSHYGISVKGIIRSSLINLYKGRIIQGASTITQQLVKLLYFDGKRSFRRKIKEQVVALLVERQFTKHQIIQTYLNHVYFGCGIYGVEAASQRFWGKSANALTLAQAATLAGIVRSPNNYCPLLSAENALKRRNVVLKCMENLGYITEMEYQHARQE
ncbi:MAG TPA: biosynthetic peptidoglycan transglycosylase, partial [Candidatus Babeliaceae bacterium]|nr:biosynthetic peptidoglycan transglycosylase [Candidatus Babeliaceae bacterium]